MVLAYGFPELPRSYFESGLSKFWSRTYLGGEVFLYLYGSLGLYKKRFKMVG